jgi:hypothetical protein
MSRIGTDESKTRLANERAELIGKYRHVFLSSPMGHEVLADILQSARFLQLQRPGDPLDAAGQNFGIIILQRCGILTEGASMREIVDALAQILPKTQEETT